MPWFMFLSVCVALSCITLLVTGQCTVSNCEVSDSRSEESLLKRLEEHDYIMRSAVDTKFQTMNETLSSAIDKINEKLNVILGNVYENIQYSRSQDTCPNNNQVACDCSDIRVNGHTTSGVYRIYVVDGGQRYYANAYCDMTTENRGWTVFQRRKDGSVDFFREWSDYANGFGNPDGEFWLGNDFLYRLSSKKRYRLRIDLEDFEGGNRYAEYSTFNISSSADKYRLTIDNYSGTAGDSFSYNSGHRFTTKDNDNDANSSLNCAVDRHGAWWHDDCTWSNLNGRYLRGRYSSTSGIGIQWQGWHSVWYSLKATEMKVSSY